jgi:hypothetical protein
LSGILSLGGFLSSNFIFGFCVSLGLSGIIISWVFVWNCLGRAIVYFVVSYLSGNRFCSGCITLGWVLGLLISYSLFFLGFFWIFIVGILSIRLSGWLIIILLLGCRVIKPWNAFEIFIVDLWFTEINLEGFVNLTLRSLVKETIVIFWRGVVPLDSDAIFVIFVEGTKLWAKTITSAPTISNLIFIVLAHSSSLTFPRVSAS